MVPVRRLHSDSSLLGIPHAFHSPKQEINVQAKVPSADRVNSNREDERKITGAMVKVD